MAHSSRPLARGSVVHRRWHTPKQDGTWWRMWTGEDHIEGLTALAEPREVPVFGMVKDLVVESGIDFGDRGDHQLKGVPGSWKLFDVEP